MKNDRISLSLSLSEGCHEAAISAACFLCSDDPHSTTSVTTDAAIFSNGSVQDEDPLSTCCTQDGLLQSHFL